MTSINSCQLLLLSYWRFGQLKGAQEVPKAARIKDWRALRNMQNFALGITKIFLKAIYFPLEWLKVTGRMPKGYITILTLICLIWVTEVDYSTALHKWTQLLIFSKKNSPYIQRSDGSNVHSVHSSITSQAWLNHLCSYETGRQVLLHFTDGDREARD